MTVKHGAALAALATWIGWFGACSSDPAEDRQRQAAVGDAQAGLGCAGDTETVQRLIFAPRCGLSACHEATEPAQGLDLVSPGVETRVATEGLCGRPIVLPGNAAGSYLVTKVEHPEPSCGAPMPMSGERLPGAEIECIKQWIDALPAAPVSAPGTGGTGGRTGVSQGGSRDGGASAPVLGDAAAGGAAGAPPKEPSCPEGEIDCDGSCIAEIAPTIGAIQERIFDRSCTFDSCHGGISPKEGLDLQTEAASLASLVGVASEQMTGALLVDAGSPESSYLINKLRGEGMAAESSTGKEAEIMPRPPSAPLCEAKIAAIEAWIASGAPGG